ncbi:hypothetical protein OAO01_08425 [Oligoflexia bacterium]|nr:hypothetical protein [Oligoflexia bacterium]
MPVTKFQTKVLTLLRQHRNPNSYVAGGVAIHRRPNSIRYSNDIDYFHDTDEAVTAGTKADLLLLREASYQVTILIDQPSFVRAVITKGEESLKLEWARDTAFRFFPVIEDDDLGYRLHDVDLAVNKCLALANRSEIRDIIDLIQLNGEVLSLTAACWAACGKDPGFTPELLLDYMRRNSIIRSENLLAESLTQEYSPSQLKQIWLQLLDQATTELGLFPVEDLGCIYLNGDGAVVHYPDPKKLKDKHQHFGSIGGSWSRPVNSGA